MSRTNQLKEILQKAKEKKAPETSATPADAKAGKKIDESPIAYYDSSRGGFWHRNNFGEYTNWTEASIRRVLKYELFSNITDKDLQFSMIDKKFIDMQHNDCVSYAGDIAGYKTGLHEICGQRVLVTSGPKLITPKAGDWKLLADFIGVLLGDQARVFYYWLKSALRSLYAGSPFRPGQMLAIAGPAGCGKSLLQNLITEMLGGRSAKPYRYMIGDTSFNSDLFRCEHLMIEDEAASTDLRIRRHFGSQLKNMIVNEVQSLHRKGRDALSVSPFWRVTITLNDEPENLMVLPPLDESLKDKIILLRAMMPEFPYCDDDMNGRRDFRTKLSQQIPAFLHWLRGVKIPASMSDRRFGVKAFQDPILARELEDLAPESRLLTLIDTLWVWGIDKNPWEGTASQLEELLLEKDKSGRVKSLLYFQTACGVYLGRLMHRFPERILKSKDYMHSRKWKILPRD